MSFVRESFWPGPDFDLVDIVRRCQAAGLELLMRKGVPPSHGWILAGTDDQGDDVVMAAGPLEAMPELALRWSGGQLALSPTDFRFFAQRAA